jgi:hypothetical protein
LSAKQRRGGDRRDIEIETACLIPMPSSDVDTTHDQVMIQIRPAVSAFEVRDPCEIREAGVV